MEHPMCAQKGAYEVQVKEGEKYSWCTCGRSTTQPYCDDKSHEGTSFKPHEFTARFTGPVEICGCKSTKTPPFCDGAHEKIDVSHLAT